jgi:hypothetical protein
MVGSSPSGGVSEGEVARSGNQHASVGVSGPWVRRWGGVDDDGVVVVESAGDESVCVRIECDGRVAGFDEVEPVGDACGDVVEGDGGCGEVVAECGPFVDGDCVDGCLVGASVDDEGSMSGVGGECGEGGGGCGYALSAFVAVDGEYRHGKRSFATSIGAPKKIGVQGLVPCSRWLPPFAGGVDCQGVGAWWRLASAASPQVWWTASGSLDETGPGQLTHRHEPVSPT